MKFLRQRTGTFTIGIEFYRLAPWKYMFQFSFISHRFVFCFCKFKEKDYKKEDQRQEKILNSWWPAK